MSGSARLARALYQHVVKPWVFLLPAERAHEIAAAGLHVVHASSVLRAVTRRVLAPEVFPGLALTVFGRTFSTPVGVAAGFDKGATLYNALGAMGFASVEVGTVTAFAQPGNDRPRLFRLPLDRALVNRMGFNNPGAHAARRAIERHPPDGLVLGVNLGKSKVTPLEEAPADYAASARELGALAHYLVINVSSPNTPGLRSLQSVEALGAIVRAVRAACGEARRPLLVKIAPDLADEDIDAVVDFCLAEKVDGLVATNTTVTRAGLATTAREVEAIGVGGLSGAPVRRRATEVIARAYKRADGRLPIVGVGGVSSADDAWEKLEAGASLVQVYTGFIYEGPTLAADITRGLAARMVREGVTSIAEVVGRAHAK